MIDKENKEEEKEKKKKDDFAPWISQEVRDYFKKHRLR